MSSNELQGPLITTGTHWYTETEIPSSVPAALREISIRDVNVKREGMGSFRGA